VLVFRVGSDVHLWVVLDVLAENDLAETTGLGQYQPIRHLQRHLLELCSVELQTLHIGGARFRAVV